jgi:hypothetical protein
MATVAERLQKRRFYPIEIEGETVHVRALLQSETKRMMEFGGEPESFGFALGCCLLNDDGSPAYTANPEEGDKAFGARVLAELDLPSDTTGELCHRIAALAKGPPDLAKN